MSDEKIVKGKATVYPTMYMRKMMEKKEESKMNMWEFLDKQFERTINFLMTPCGLFVFLALAVMICSLCGVF